MGEHSGENMADIVWQSLDRYGLTGRVSQNNVFVHDSQN
jgi:hypothetical protein